VGASLKELPSFNTIDDTGLLDLIASDAIESEYDPTDADPIVKAGSHDAIYIIVKGKVAFTEDKTYHEDHTHPSLGPGQFFGEGGLFHGGAPLKNYTAFADTKVTLLKILYTDIKARLTNSTSHGDHLTDHLPAMDAIKDRANRKGESFVDIYTGLHDKDHPIPSNYVEYDSQPDEIELFAGQTILNVHTKVADLYNNPHNQAEEQVRLTIEELRERQEHEMVNNKNFGLLSKVDPTQVIHTRTGPPTPDDMDHLLSKRRKTKYIFAHPKALAAFLRECNKKSIYPGTVEVNGSEVVAWRGCPILTCNKIPVDDHGHSSIIAMRVGEEDQGVVGLQQLGIPEEVEPSLSVRYMGINDQAVISYLITNYYSLAILVPDALGVLTNVETNVHHDNE